MADIYNCQVGFWQHQFLQELFRAVFSLRGRVNFTNLARFSFFHEQTFRRHFQKAFRWVWFNLTVFRLRRHPKEPIIGVFDCSFLPKSGTQTWGLDQFFSSLAGRSKQGLEVSILGIVATESRRAFGVDATQTPPDLSKSEADGYSRVDFYLEQIIDLYDRLAGLGVSYWVTGGFYAKQKVFDTAGGLGGDLITRLRSDANLRYLYTGPPIHGTADTRDRRYTGPPKDGPGRPKQYDGKIDWDDREELSRRFDEVSRLPGQPEVRLLTTVANSPHFGRDLRVVLLIGPGGEQVILASTDTSLCAEEVARYYRLRYQIEFVIRDAKQHTGLTHCQARSQEKLDFHLNMSVAMVNMLRLLARKAECSLRTYRREAYNRLLIRQLFSKLGLSAEYDRADPRVQAVVRTGRMAV